MMQQLTAKSGNLCRNRPTMCRNDERSGSYLKYKQRAGSLPGNIAGNLVKHGNRMEATSPVLSLIGLCGSAR